MLCVAVCHVSRLGAFSLHCNSSKTLWLEKGSTSANGKKNAFPLYLYWRVSGSIYDLMRRQRRRLCKANMRRRQSFHHHGEPPETKSLTWKGYFKVINCLTCLTWVCEGLRDPGWSHNRVAVTWKNAAWIFLICQVEKHHSPRHVQRADAVTAIELVTPPTDFLFSFLFF